MVYLNSSAIHAVHYNPSSATLTVWFTNGGHGYDYYSVPAAIYQGLLAAPSKGRYFAMFIRDQYGG